MICVKDEDGDSEQQSGEGGQGGGDGMSPEELAELLYQALMRGDDTLMRAIARQALKRFAGMEPGRPVGGTYYLYRTLRNLVRFGFLAANKVGKNGKVIGVFASGGGRCVRAASRNNAASCTSSQVAS